MKAKYLDLYSPLALDCKITALLFSQIHSFWFTTMKEKDDFSWRLLTLIVNGQIANVIHALNLVALGRPITIVEAQYKHVPEPEGGWVPDNIIVTKPPSGFGRTNSPLTQDRWKRQTFNIPPELTPEVAQSWINLVNQMYTDEGYMWRYFVAVKASDPRAQANAGLLKLSREIFESATTDFHRAASDIDTLKQRGNPGGETWMPGLGWRKQDLIDAIKKSGVYDSRVRYRPAAGPKARSR